MLLMNRENRSFVYCPKNAKWYSHDANTLATLLKKVKHVPSIYLRNCPPQYYTLYKRNKSLHPQKNKYTDSYNSSVHNSSKLWAHPISFNKLTILFIDTWITIHHKVINYWYIWQVRQITKNCDVTKANHKIMCARCLNLHNIVGMINY